MPPKDPVKADGRLYWFSDGGTYEPIGPATIIDTISDVDEMVVPEEITIKSWPDLQEDEHVFAIFGTVNTQMLRYLLGHKMTNNWLKMHGFKKRRLMAWKEAFRIGALTPRPWLMLDKNGCLSVWKGREYDEPVISAKDRSDA